MHTKVAAPVHKPEAVAEVAGMSELSTPLRAIDYEAVELRLLTAEAYKTRFPELDRHIERILALNPYPSGRTLTGRIPLPPNFDLAPQWLAEKGAR